MTTLGPFEGNIVTIEEHVPDSAIRPKSLRMLYLVSKYPAVSHTFILREVVALRQRGIEIEVASINDAPSRDQLTQVEQAEADRTFFVKSVGFLGALKSALWLAFRRPLGLVRGLIFAIGLGSTDVGRVLKCFFYYVEAIILARWMMERSSNHLHVHFATQAATVALILTRIAPITFSLTVHGPDEFFDVRTFYLSDKIANAEFVACISFFAQSQLMKLAHGRDWRKFELARLGVDCSHFTPRQFRPRPDCFEVLCVGRLVPAKGQRVLIHVLKTLVEDGRKLRLSLVGEGPDRVELERMVRDNGLSAYVHFAGAINQDCIQDYYSAADIFVLASFAEGIPVVLMEAMAMEIPCVATTINGIPELIRDGIDGLLVAPSDIAGMSRSLARLMDDPPLRESLGKAGRLRVQSEYEIARSADRLADVFRSRLERP